MHLRIHSEILPTIVSDVVKGQRSVVFMSLASVVTKVGRRYMHALRCLYSLIVLPWQNNITSLSGLELKNRFFFFKKICI